MARHAGGEGLRQEDYQAALFTTNASGVVAWQAYVLGFDAGDVDTAAIVEETVQDADPNTVTIRLKDMPTPPSDTGCSISYSLLSATSTKDFANGSAKPVDGNGFVKSEHSTFEAPLNVLTDDSSVRYYQIRVHFTFGGDK